MQCVKERMGGMIKHGVCLCVCMCECGISGFVCKCLGGWGFSLHSSKGPWIIQSCREPFRLRQAEQWRAGAGAGTGLTKLGWVIPKCSFLHRSSTWTEVYLKTRSKNRGGGGQQAELNASLSLRHCRFPPVFTARLPWPPPLITAHLFLTYRHKKSVIWLPITHPYLHLFSNFFSVYTAACA